MIKFVVKNMKQFQREIEAEEKRVLKAGRTAAQKVGYDLRRKLKKEISQGGKGPLRFGPLSVIARYRGKESKLLKGKRSQHKALSGLARAIFYNPIKKAGQFIAEVGFTDFRGGKISKFWKRIAEKQQSGFTATISEHKRKYWARVGSELKSRDKSYEKMSAKGKTRDADYFFVSKGKVVRTKARPIISPFWNRHAAKAETDLMRYWDAKMRGERI